MTIVESKKTFLKSKSSDFRVYMLIALIYISIFVKEYNLGNNKLEWFLVFDVFIILDMLLYAFNNKKIVKNSIINYMLLFIFYNIILLLISILMNKGNYVVGIIHFGRVIGLLAFYPWISYMFKPKNILKFINVFLITLYIFAIYFIMDLKFINKFANFTYYGFFNPRLEFGNLRTNLLGYILVMFIIFIQTYEKKLYRKTIFSILFIFLVMQTFSKIAMLALILYFSLKLFSVTTKEKYNKILILSFATIVLFIILAIFGERILQYKMFYRINEIIGVLKSGKSIMDTDEASRILVQSKFLSDKKWNPITGYYYYYFFSRDLATVHNYYIELLYDTGIVGLMIFMKLIQEIYKKIKNKKIYILEIILIYNLTENYFFYFIPVILLYIMIEYNELEVR